MLRLFFGFWLLAALPGCLGHSASPKRAAKTIIEKKINPILWQGSPSTQDTWQEHWKVRARGQWGVSNLQVIRDMAAPYHRIWRVHYPRGSASPVVYRRKQGPLGGMQFYADLGIAPRTAVQFSYAVRFSPDFNFMKGGKLPGLFGGRGRHGRKLRQRGAGFSTRLMWRRKGKGEVYAYLPTSKKYGTSLGRGRWHFRPSVWHRIRQEVILNQPGQTNGRMRLWVDGRLVLEEKQLNYRTHDRVKIEGIFFSTFFGGGNISWATPKDVYIDFADFAVSEARE